MKRCLQLFTAFALLVVAVSNAHATQVNTTLKVLIDNGWTVTAGDKLFDRFSFSGDALPENFQVIALNDGGLDPGPGLHFNVLNNAMEVFDGDSKSVQIGFRVTVLNPNLRVKDVSLSLLQGGFTVDAPEDEAGVTIIESVGTTSGSSDLSQLSVSAYDPGVPTLTDSGAFTGRSEIWVTKQISVFTGDLDDYANLTSFEQRFSQEPAVPEPITAGLTVLALSTLALTATRRRQA
ncbi:MAG: hypothetical protein K8S99_02895 [Planctomycetes bacterium]|nr:hypothetical protein [Planctomycetota bacterium]